MEVSVCGTCVIYVVIFYLFNKINVNKRVVIKYCGVFFSVVLVFLKIKVLLVFRAIRRN